ncbi:hypothetical protein ARSEF4850_004357 [Beauveria asiatica]
MVFLNAKITKTICPAPQPRPQPQPQPVQPQCGQAWCMVTGQNLSQIFPNLQILPRPEPSCDDEEAHKAWQEEYSHWGLLRCECGRGYFCREHGDWISGDEVGDGVAPTGSSQKAGSCPGSHYEGCRQPQNHCPASLYDALPRADDVFHFIPCTNATIPPSLDDPNPESTWQGLFEPNPDHWSWADSDRKASDACSGRGIYLCGYLDLPLDYYNASDKRIVRLAITKLQVAGLALAKPAGSSRTAAANCTSGRTIVLEPGGPGASGTNEVWIRGEKISQRLSDGELDVLGWDPRGVNVSLPLASCFAHNSYRDHWSLFADQYREASVSPMSQLRAADAMNKATFFACQQRFGDFGRFLSTTFAALDLEGIRNSLGEDDLSAYFVSYGTAVGQTYAAMFPDKVGRMVLDGNVYFKDYRTLGMDSYNSFANVTDVWVDGFLGECVRAGPDKCALAQSKEGDNRPVTLENLQARMESLVQSLAKAPIPAYLESTGPMLITYSEFVKVLYPALYLPTTWASVASMLRELERGNTTAAAKRISSFQSGPAEVASRPFSFELTNLVVCADAHNSPSPPDDLQWWDNLWANYTQKFMMEGELPEDQVSDCYANEKPYRYSKDQWF